MYVEIPAKLRKLVSEGNVVCCCGEVLDSRSVHCYVLFLHSQCASFAAKRVKCVVGV